MPEPDKDRQYLRFQVHDMTLSYELHGSSHQPFNETCPILNLSKGGLGFKTDNQLKPGQKLTVVLTYKEALIRLQAQVIHCISHPRIGQRHHVGVKFEPFAASNGCNSLEALDVLDQLEKESTKWSCRNYAI
jgi:hypothetical protein